MTAERCEIKSPLRCVRSLIAGSSCSAARQARSAENVFAPIIWWSMFIECRRTRHREERLSSASYLTAMK